MTSVIFSSFTHPRTFALLTVAWSLASAQAAQAQTIESQYFYAIQNLETGEVVRRGSYVRDAATARRLPAHGLPRGSVILAPETRFRYRVLQVESLHVGRRDFETPQSGSSWSVGRVRLTLPSSSDTDGDGLHAEAEFIIGTDQQDPDTDGDGIDDGAEIEQGLDPLDGTPARTGVIASVDTPGTAVDIVAVDDMAIVADADRGVSVFNIFNGMDPVIVAQVDTPGSARRVALAERSIVVADGTGGLAVIDISDPQNAQIARQVTFQGPALCVEAGGGVAFVGLAGNELDSSELVTVDLASGIVLEHLPTASPPVDIKFGEDLLYFATSDHLYAVSLADDELSIVGSVRSPILSTGIVRLFVGGGIAYTVHGKGYNTFSLANPTQPTLVAAGDTPQFGWRQLALNGSGLAFAAVGPDADLSARLSVSVYDTSDPAETNGFLDTFATPGFARSVSIYNGLGYVADHARGLQVVNYLRYDDGDIPPVIDLATSFSGGIAEEGRLVRVTAAVEDDVQVRNVEFHIDGAKVFTDGNFPFEYRFVTPRIVEQASFRLRARASDTGGNATWSIEIDVVLQEDLTPPRIVRVSPPHQSFRGGVRSVAAFFNEALDASTLTASSFQLAGEDGPVAPASVEYRDAAFGAFLFFDDDLAPGPYTATLRTAVADRAGNAVAAAQVWTFTVFDGALGDTDGDCLIDALELELGLNPGVGDSDGDGIPDGDEDSDGDGLANCDEVLRALDPGEADTDLDGLSDGEEIALATNPLAPDTDGDGFLDGEEQLDGSDPLVAASTPVSEGETVRELALSTVAVLNEADPTVAVDEITATSVSVLNAADPTIDDVREAAGGGVSVRNETP